MVVRPAWDNGKNNIKNNEIDDLCSKKEIRTKKVESGNLSVKV